MFTRKDPLRPHGLRDQRSSPLTLRHCKGVLWRTQENQCHWFHGIAIKRKRFSVRNSVVTVLRVHCLELCFPNNAILLPRIIFHSSRLMPRAIQTISNTESSKYFSLLGHGPWKSLPKLPMKNYTNCWEYDDAFQIPVDCLPLDCRIIGSLLRMKAWWWNSILPLSNCSKK